MPTNSLLKKIPLRTLKPTLHTCAVKRDLPAGFFIEPKPPLAQMTILIFMALGIPDRDWNTWEPESTAHRQ